MVVSRPASRAVARAVSPEPQHEAVSCKITLSRHAQSRLRRVIEGCAEDRHEGTRITRDIIIAYHQLHELGYAHSIEVWKEDNLVGGMYGVAQGTLFCGESMFSRATNASKPRCWCLARNLPVVADG